MVEKKNKKSPYNEVTKLGDGRYAYNWTHKKSGKVMGVFMHGKPDQAKQKALRSHFADYKPSASKKNFEGTFKKFPGLTTINASKGPPIPYMAAKFRLKNKKSGEMRDVIKVTSELSSSWE